MSILRKSARGQACQVRIPGVCNGNPETTVLAHVRMAGITGAGQKAPDLLGAWACSACHEVTEREKGDDWIQRLFYEGVMRTQYHLISKGLNTHGSTRKAKAGRPSAGICTCNQGDQHE